MYYETFDFDSAKRYKLNRYGEAYTIVLQETKYRDGKYAVAMHSWNEEFKFYEPWDTLTTNLLDSREEGLYAYVQTDKYLNFVLENSIGIPTGRIAKSGFNSYTEIKFTINGREEV